MAELAGFFNAFPDATSQTGYDKNYSAEDVSDALAQVIETGVFKGGLAVTAGEGLSVNVAIGAASIRGHWYKNTAIKNLELAAAPTGSSARYDLIVLRLDNTQTQSARTCYLAVKTGTSSTPTTAGSLQRDVSQYGVYELLLGYVKVDPNATTIAQADITDTRGYNDAQTPGGQPLYGDLANCCPYVTAVKGYQDYYDAIIQQFEYNTELASTTATVVTSLTSNLYNDKYSIIDVYTNGLKEENTQYSVNVSNGYIAVTFTQAKAAGTNVSVVLKNFIDGEGLTSAIAQYNQWVQDVAELKAANSYTYVCNGETDNVEISNLVNAFINGGTDYNSLNLKIVGTFGYTNFYSGDGSTSNPYRLFNIYAGNRRVTLDFSNCSQIEVTTTGQCVTAFVGENLTVKNLNLIMNDTGTNSILKAFYNAVNCVDCRFWINGYNNSVIANAGNFKNCRGSVSNATGNSYCFINKDILRIYGGTYYAYTGGSSAKSAVVGQSATNAIAILYGVNAPTSARSGYYQTNSIYQTNSPNYINCTDLISTLALSVVSGYSNIRGTIPINKA